LHDASEAYIADVSRPVKHTDMMAGYRLNETRLMLKIFEALEIDGNWTNVFVASADCQMLALEARSLLPYDPWMDDLPIIADVELGLWGPSEAERRFLERYYDLTT